MPSVTRRPPAVAGRFYPGESALLRAEVERLLNESKAGSPESAVSAVIAPHAGYLYSGGTAAHAFARAAAKRPKRVVDFRASGHVLGGYSRVVGYAAVSMERLN